MKTDREAGRDGISLLVVEDGIAGLRARPEAARRSGLHAQDLAELFFDDVRVPVANLLGEENKGFEYLTATSRRSDFDRGELAGRGGAPR